MSQKYQVSFVQPNFQQGPKEFNAFYLPYSVGVIWAYAQADSVIQEKFEIDQIIWRRDAVDEVADRLAQSDIVAFSTYVWNHQYNYTLAAEVRKRNPRAFILVGGPEPAITDPDIFKTIPWCDAIIKHEGEITFRAILLRYAEGKSFDDLPGILINQQGKAIDTGDARRIESLDEIPSPYLIGLYDQIIKENPGIEWNATLETNRGCPFQCTFCDWGSLTYNKVKKFELQRVYDELEWFGKHHCGFLSITDANFGMFPERDNLIADKIIEVQKKYGYPKTFSVAWAKNQKREVVGIVKKLLEAPGFNQGLTLSVQSLDVDVLENIRRRNMEVNKLEEVFELCEQRNIPTYTEMILGLPGETLDSWKENFWKLFRMGNHTGLTVFQAQLLQNAEMNLLQRKLYGIKSAVVTDYFSGSYSNEHIEEGIEIVTATKDLPPEVMLDAEIFSWYINNFHVNGITTLISRVLYHLKGIDYKEFYTDFFEFLQHDLWYQKEQHEVRQYYANWMRDGKINHPHLAGIEIHGWNLIHRTVLNIHVEKKYDHVFGLVEKFIDRYNLEPELRENVMRFQREYLIAYDNINQYPKQLELDYNIWEFVTQDVALERKRSVLELEFPEDKSMSFPRFLELYYFARRRNFGKAQVTSINASS